MLCVGGVFPEVIPEERRKHSLPEAEEVVFESEEILLFFFFRFQFSYLKFYLIASVWVGM